MTEIEHQKQGCLELGALTLPHFWETRQDRNFKVKGAMFCSLIN